MVYTSGLASEAVRFEEQKQNLYQLPSRLGPYCLIVIFFGGPER